MATKPKTDSKSAKAQALVLVDTPSHGLKVGQIVESDEAEINALGAQVDAHPDAVAYAAGQGAEVVAWPQHGGDEA